ncbi:MAG: RDD family protein [Nitrospinota bacterium]|nr:RDD family protein [Nitrospinota bacterium]MDP7580843.1 RDD family protein [Nitrospinota bacterium]HJN02462.1 RDD family protein [Nitrospinota bacterium]
MVKIGFWKRAVAITIDLVFLDVSTKISLLPLKRSIDLGDIIPADLFSMDTFQAKVFLLYVILYLFVGLILSLVYFTYFHSATGQSIGKRLLKIKAIQTSGEPLNFKIAFIRWGGYFISGLAMYLGFLWVLFDKNKQGWHDKIAGTYVVKV